MSNFTLRRNETPGKFEGALLIDEHVYGLTLEGWCDEETGDVSELGWFGKLSGPIALPSDVDATPDERAYLGSIVGAIVSEDNNGFVSVEYFDDIDAMDDRWGCIEEAYSEADEEEAEQEEDGPQNGTCWECGFDDEWTEDGRGNVLCSCQACPDCGLVDAYGMHNPGCPRLNEEDSEEDSDSDDGQREEDDERDNDNLGV